MMIKLFSTKIIYYIKPQQSCALPCSYYPNPFGPDFTNTDITAVLQATKLHSCIYKYIQQNNLIT